MLNLFQSKTVVGLCLILAVACVMAFLGKLTPELADVLKWAGASYLGVRGVANAFENLPGNKSE